VGRPPVNRQSTATFDTAIPSNLVTLVGIEDGAMAEFLLFAGVLVLFGLAFWLTADSDDDNSGGGLMQPALVPVRVRPHR
jgi:hypothetical protein